MKGPKRISKLVQSKRTTSEVLPPRRSGGRPTLQEARELTARILEVATKHFLRFGYHDTSFDRIAREAGTSKGALYVRYPEKVHLFSAVCEQLITTHYNSDIVSLDERMPMRASLVKQATALLAAAMHPTAFALYDMITRDAPRHPELAKSTLAVWTFYITQMQRYFENRISKGLLNLRNPARAAERFAQMVFGPIHVCLIHGAEIPSPESLAHHVEETVLVFLGGIGRLELEQFDSV